MIVSVNPCSRSSILLRFVPVEYGLSGLHHGERFYHLLFNLMMLLTFVETRLKTLRFIFEFSEEAEDLFRLRVSGSFVRQKAIVTEVGA